MAETQTWRAVLTDGSVREVFVRFIEMTMSPGVMRWVVSSPSGRGAGFGDTRDEAISGWVRMNSDVRDILAPGEPTRAELAARLATATASVQQLRADVELATAQRDAEACRADNTETERDAALEECSTLRRGLDHTDDVIDHTRASLGAADDEGASVAAQRVTRELAVLRAQQAPLVALFDEVMAAARAAGLRGAGHEPAEVVAAVRRLGACEGAVVVRDAAMSVADDLAPDGPEASDCEWAHELMHRVAAAVARVREGGE